MTGFFTFLALLFCGAGLFAIASAIHNAAVAIVRALKDTK